MTRPIKFRAYTETQHEVLGMLYGVPHDYNNTVMQFTGLLDKNGKEIYEGDVVASEEEVIADGKNPKVGKYEIETRREKDFRYSDGTKGTRIWGKHLVLVEWKDTSCGFEPFSDSAGNCGHCGGGENASNFEVIGNIYENPELLNT